jgi:hypothetical protein
MPVSLPLELPCSTACDAVILHAVRVDAIGENLPVRQKRIELNCDLVIESRFAAAASATPWIACGW